MLPAYSDSNDDTTSTITPSDSTDPDSTYYLRNEDGSNGLERGKTHANKSSDNEKLYYSTSELQSRRRTRRNEVQKISICKPL